MTNHTNINELENGMSISGLYIIDNIRPSTTRTGTPYMSATLCDASGKIDAVWWEYDQSISPENNGAIVAVIDFVKTYRETLQLCVEQMDLADADSYGEEELLYLVPVAPINAEDYSICLHEMVCCIENRQIRELCQYLLDNNWERFYRIPAGKSVHHAFLHGLLMHTVDMLFVAEKVAAVNPNAVNLDLLVCGIVLHDIGKVREFDISPITGLVTGYSTEGNLLGHSIIGAQMVAEAAEAVGADKRICQVLQHMLLSHHGDPASGAAKVPATIEAEILHGLDMLDSRKEIFREALRNAGTGGFSDYIPALDRRVFQHGIEEK